MKQPRLDITKAKRILRSEPEIDLEQGLGKTYEYFGREFQLEARLTSTESQSGRPSE